jgi:hypothetical protein
VGLLSGEINSELIDGGCPAARHLHPPAASAGEPGPTPTASTPVSSSSTGLNGAVIDEAWMTWRSAAHRRSRSKPQVSDHDSSYRQHRNDQAPQNAAYNQPPHLGFFLGAGMTEPPRLANIYQP